MSEYIQNILKSIEPRILLCCTAVIGSVAWLAPVPILFFLFPLGCSIGWVASRKLPFGHSLLRAYGIFLLVWTSLQAMFFLFEHPEAYAEAFNSAILLGARLASMLGIALSVVLALTPLQVGRALSSLLVFFLRGTFAVAGGSLPCTWRVRLGTSAWKAGLSVAVMLVFLPRVIRAFSAFRLSLRLRCPRLGFRDKSRLLALGLLRVFSQEAWHITLAIASRHLYHAQPWSWEAAKSALKR